MNFINEKVVIPVLEIPIMMTMGEFLKDIQSPSKSDPRYNPQLEMLISKGKRKKYLDEFEFNKICELAGLYSKKNLVDFNNPKEGLSNETVLMFCADGHGVTGLGDFLKNAEIEPQKHMPGFNQEAFDLILRVKDGNSINKSEFKTVCRAIGAITIEDFN